MAMKAIKPGNVNQKMENDIRDKVNSDNLSLDYLQARVLSSFHRLGGKYRANTAEMKYQIDRNDSSEGKSSTNIRSGDREADDLHDFNHARHNECTIHLHMSTPKADELILHTTNVISGVGSLHIMTRHDGSIDGIYGSSSQYNLSHPPVTCRPYSHPTSPPRHLVVPKSTIATSFNCSSHPIFSIHTISDSSDMHIAAASQHVGIDKTLHRYFSDETFYETIAKKKDGYEGDRLVLQEIYHHCHGDRWICSDGWIAGDITLPLRLWYGVKVSQGGYVEELDLSYNNLTGNFPDQIERLTKLRVLILDGNMLRGELPDYVFNHMPHLQVLSLRRNRFRGPVPWIAISFLKNIKELWLSHNSFDGEVDSDAIGHLQRLEYLSLSNNKFSGYIPDTLGYLEQLEVLSLGSNQFIGTVPTGIHLLRRLRYLYLHDNKLEGVVPEWIGDFEYLIELSLKSNRFEGYVYSDIHDYKAIQQARLMR